MQPGNRQPSSTSYCNCGASSPGRLWGAQVRVSLGVAQIMTGLLELLFGNILIALLWNYFDFGQGIWCGVFAIVTGCYGIASQKKECLVIAYRVLSILNAVMSGGCFILTIFSASASRHLMFDTYQYKYCSNGRARSHYALSIVLCILFAGQGVISIISASFTCRAPRGNGPAETQAVVNYQHTQPSLAMNEPAPPYHTVVGSPTAPASDLQNCG